jgi:ABC-2 type transport system permease protein
VLLRIRTLIRKEFIQMRRDWLLTAFIFTLPVLQLVLLGQATGSSISNLSVAVLDHDHSRVSRQLITILDKRQELDIRHYPATLEDTRKLLDRGEARFAVVIPAGFAAELIASSRTPSIQIIADASNDLLADVALGAAQGAIAALEADSARASHSLGKRGGYVELRTTVRFNPAFNVRFFSVPAQVGFIIYQVTLTVASTGLARERELGTLEQLIVMPLRRIELIIGKAIPALIVGVLNFLLMLMVAIFGFGVPMRGSFSLLFAFTVLFIVAEIGYGLFISNIAHTQQQAILFVFVLAMVEMAFSGYMVRVKNLPATLQTIALLVPFRHYLTIIRAVMLKGAGWQSLWPHALAIVLMGLFIAAMAVRALSQRLD